MLLDGIQDYYLSHHVAAGGTVTLVMFFITDWWSVSFPPNGFERR
jgi:hypothetical protein